MTVQPTTKLLQITNYLYLSGVVLPVKMILDSPKDPRVLTCITQYHAYKMAFNCHGSTIGYALADNIRRETAGHLPGGTCPFCSANPKE